MATDAILNLLMKWNGSHSDEDIYKELEAIKGKNVDTFQDDLSRALEHVVGKAISLSPGSGLCTLL